MKRCIFTILLVLFLVSSASGETAECTRDSFFPEAGNCGYDAENYSLEMEWDDRTDEWSVDEVLTFTALWDTDELHFDFSPVYELTGLTVDGTAADYERDGNDLKILGNFAHDTRYRLYASFHGKLDFGYIFDPEGQNRGANGAFCMLNEPAETSRYFICNDHPKDKATFHYSITVPAARSAAGVGRLVQIEEADGTVIRPDGDFFRPAGSGSESGKVRYVFETEEPTAAYLFSVCCGDFDMTFSSAQDGTQHIDFIDPLLSEPDRLKAGELAGRLEEMISFLEEIFGPYPYSTDGVIVSSAPFDIALEAQTRSIYAPEVINESTFVHETAHQWVGDLVSVGDWSDLWIKEGAATYAAALWQKRNEGQEAFENRIREIYRASFIGNEAVVPADNVAVFLNTGWKIDPDREFDTEIAAQTYEAFTHSEFPEAARESEKISYQDWLSLLTSFDGDVYETHDSVLAVVEMTGEPGFLKYFPEVRIGPKQISPEPDSMYESAAYSGGALVYYVLNQELGDEGFRDAVWYLLEKYRFGTVTTKEFIKTMNEASGRDLSELIRSWLYYVPYEYPDIPGIDDDAGSVYEGSAEYIYK